MKIELGKIKVRLLKDEIEPLYYYYGCKKEIPCPICEADKIESRFEILDL